MMKMKVNKKIAGASAMLMLSATMLGTSTFAWFTMNKEVKVSGMEVKTKVSGNLLICEDNVESRYSNDELVQARKALLEPVSTVSGKDGSFYYTLDAAADGHKIHSTTSGTSATPYVLYGENTSKSDAAADKTQYDNAFNSAYGITTAATDGEYNAAYGYVDYTFYLKATSDAANQDLRMTRCNIVKDNGTSGTSVLADDNDAWRVAVFAMALPDSDTHAGVWSTSVTDSNADAAKTILTPAGATNFTANEAVSSTTATSAVAYNTAATIDTISTVGTTKYYKVVVRLWLEGEDTSCFSEYYAANKELYKVDLMFELGKGTAVTNIGSTTAAPTPASGT